MKRNFFETTKLTGLIAGMFLIITSCEKDPVPVTGITLDKTTATIQVGATSNLSAFLTPADADNMNVIWRSSNQAAATVTAGVVTGVAIGSSVITAIAEGDTTIRTTCEVTVTPSTGQVINISGDITADTKWYAAGNYMLNGFVYVKN